jgi:hypothetical protein
MEILTILVPSSIDIQPTSRRTGEGLTASDVSAALAGANEPGLRLLLGQICGVSEYKAVYDLFYPEAIKVARRLKWRSDSVTLARTRKLLDIVLIESIASNKCPSCHGTKYSYINPSKFCELCSGTGLTKRFDYLKAKHLGVSDRAWRKTWRERESDLKALLDRRTHQAKRSIINNLYGELDD